MVRKLIPSGSVARFLAGAIDRPTSAEVVMFRDDVAMIRARQTNNREIFLFMIRGYHIGFRQDVPKKSGLAGLPCFP